MPGGKMFFKLQDDTRNVPICPPWRDAASKKHRTQGVNWSSYQTTDMPLQVQCATSYFEIPVTIKIFKSPPPPRTQNLLKDQWRQNKTTELFGMKRTWQGLELEYGLVWSVVNVNDYKPENQLDKAGFHIWIAAISHRSNKDCTELTSLRFRGCDVAALLAALRTFTWATAPASPSAVRSADRRLGRGRASVAPIDSWRVRTVDLSTVSKSCITFSKSASSNFSVSLGKIGNISCEQGYCVWSRKKVRC